MAEEDEQVPTGDVLGIAFDKGYDTETGVWGYGYSPDNGTHFYVLVTIKGRKFRQEDADRLWKFLKPKIEQLIDSKIEKAIEEAMKNITSKEG